MKRWLWGVLEAVALTASLLVATTVHAEQGVHWMTWEGSCGDNCIARYEQIGDEVIVESWCCGQHAWTSSYAS